MIFKIKRSSVAGLLGEKLKQLKKMNMENAIA